MHIYSKIYDFAASVGSLEGYVYPKKMDPDGLPKWIDNLISAYQYLPPEVVQEVQPMLDATLGRAVRSLVPVLGEDHESVLRLKSMIKGEIPATEDDFQKTKWFDK